MGGNVPVDDVFANRVVLPDSDADARLARLVGMDDAIRRLSSTLEMLLFPERFEAWREEYHKEARRLFEFVGRRRPLIIIAGDVGTGKTELSETIGSRVARKNNVEITLFPLSLSSRGSGLVGEMTSLLSGAFGCIEKECGSIARTRNGGFRSGVILLIDEADALAQSREATQMHHEDKAGVNALIRGIDSLGRKPLPVAVIMCTNRMSALDPAIIRRAGEVMRFERPDWEKRHALLQSTLREVGFALEQIEEIADLTGKTDRRDHGFTYSDITQKFFHSLVVSSFPDKPISFELAKEIVRKIKPTPPFRDERGA